MDKIPKTKAGLTPYAWLLGLDSGHALKNLEENPYHPEYDKIRYQEWESGWYYAVNLDWEEAKLFDADGNMIEE